MNEFICIKVFQNKYRAEVAKAKLEAYKIQVVILSDDAGGMYPLPQGLGNGIQLLVEKKEEKRAIELLKYI